jgi:ADP-ribose pyrophosphatase
MPGLKATAEGRVVWAGDSWRLRVRTLVHAGDIREDKGFIEHPGGVVIVPLQPSGHIVMLRQYRATLKKTILELPAGTRGWDEPWLSCAQRELREETGYRATTLTPLGEAWPAPGYSDEQLRFYLATGLEADPLPADSDEQIDPVPVLQGELLDMVRDGRLRDAKSIVGIVRTAAHLGWW